jgi:multidrug efflux pump
MSLDLSDIYATIQLMLAPVYINDLNYEGRVLKVLSQADAPFRSRPEDLSHYYIPSCHGGIDDMVPLTSVVESRWTIAPPAIDHLDRYGAVQINGGAAPGYSSDGNSDGNRGRTTKLTETGDGPPN